MEDDWDDLNEEDLDDDEVESGQLEVPYFGHYLYRDGRRIDDDGDELDDELEDIEDEDAEDPSDPSNWDDEV